MRATRAIRHVPRSATAQRLASPSPGGAIRAATTASLTLGFDTAALRHRYPHVAALMAELAGPAARLPRR
jgi:hypothetical protein